MRRLGRFVPTIGQIGGDFGWKTATVNKLQDLTHCRSYLTHMYSFDEVQGTEGVAIPNISAQFDDMENIMSDDHHVRSGNALLTERYKQAEALKTMRQ